MRIFVVDSFTDRAFRGNPASVCLVGDSTVGRGAAERPRSAGEPPADDSWMREVAAEMRHSETAFVLPMAGAAGADGNTDGETGAFTATDHADFELRWFTPEIEVALCGHATLAAAHVLFETGIVPADRPVRFRTRESGVLTVRRPGDAGLEMEFPAQPAVRIEVPAGLAEALGVPVLWAGRNAQTDVLALVADERTVRALAPDLGGLAEIEARGVCVTAPAPDRPGEPVGYDFVSRFFGPRVGVPEDPVTGSAHCMLAPYWSERLGRTELIGYQASARGGFVRATVDGDRVLLAGRAVTVLEGDLLV